MVCPPGQSQGRDKMKDRCIRLLWAVAAGWTLLWPQARAELQLNGIATHQLLRQDVYVAALFLPETTRSAEAALAMPGPKRMELIVSQPRWSPRAFAESWNQGIAINNSPEQLQGLSNAIIRFSALLPASLVQQDHLVIELDQARNTRVSVNGFSLLEVPDERFFNALLRSWLGPRPPSSRFRLQLLGEEAGSTQAQAAQFRASTPSRERIAEIQAWAHPKPRDSATDTLPDISTGATSAVSGSAGGGGAGASIGEGEALVSPGDTLVQASEDEELRILRESYQSMLVQRIYNELDYPSRAMAQRQQGDVLVCARIDQDGRVLQLKLEKSSRHPMLDRAATRAVQNASPFPPPPDHIASNASFEFRVPVRFRLPN